jgi:hypothetical protein
LLRYFGIESHSDGIILSRDVGIVLLGLAVLNWTGRDADGVGLRAILTANLFVQVIELVVNGGEIVTGQLTTAAVPGIVVHAVLATIFIFAIAWRARGRAGRGVARVIA